MAPGRAPIVGRVAIGRNAVKRVIFYLFYDPQGMVDDVRPLQAAGPASLRRPHLRRLQLDAHRRGPRVLEGVADTVWVRENVGFDVWGYKEAMETFGQDRLEEYDELILMNYTFFGPIYPFERDVRARWTPGATSTSGA